MASPVVFDIPIKRQRSSFPSTNGDKASLSTVDFELCSLQSSSYTSLKDLLQSSPAVQSPTGVGTQSAYEIPIKNHLVKQAAWAYLQPMSISPSSSNRNSFRRTCVRFSSEYVSNPVNACFGFIHQRVILVIARALDRLLGAIRIRINNRR